MSKTIQALLLAGAFLGAAGLAAAQGDFGDDDGVLTGALGGDDNGFSSETGAFEDDGFEDDGFGTTGALAATGGGCIGDGDGGLVAVSDLDQSFVQEQTRDQEVEIDEDDVLLGIALANNGANDIDWNDLRDVDATASLRLERTADSDFDRDDVFSALALGIDSGAGELDALSCVSDATIVHEETATVSQQVDLEEEDVLLAIALSNSIGSSLEFEEIADMSQTERVEATTNSEVDVDREDTFLALALGAGGEGGGGGF